MRNRSRRTADRFLLAVVIVANVVVNNPISNARFWFGTICFAFLYTSTHMLGPPCGDGSRLCYS